MLVVPAPAKLNLALDVVGRRSDGFHDLDGIVVPLDWHDLVGVSVVRAKKSAATLRVTGPECSGLPVGLDNLALAAARAITESVAQPVAIDVWLDKRLPHLAGLGGGSSDAAAVLRGCAHLLRSLGLSPSLYELRSMAESLGSDVPAALSPGWWRVRGRGETLDAVPSRSMHAAVVVAGASRTDSTFAALTDAEREGGRPDSRAATRPSPGTFPPAGSAYGSERATALAHALETNAPLSDDLLGSALEAPARRVNPVLADALDLLRAATPAAIWHLTGSGGAAFALVNSQAHARSLVDAAARLGLSGRACHTLVNRAAT